MSENPKQFESSEATLHCQECAAPVAAEQRYCVICGAHLQGAPDPAARYFEQASAARARVLTAEQARAAARRSRGSRRSLPRISATFAVLVALLAAAAGFGIGRSSSGTSAPHQLNAARSSTTVHHTVRPAGGGAGATGQSYEQQEKTLGSAVAEP